MNLNDFVVPNNKTRSVKPKARNLQKLQLDTTNLASESKTMEEKLEQLKENMSKEKEERGHFRDLRWRFGQCVSSNSNTQPTSFVRTDENKLQRLSAGKLKIIILKDEPLKAPPQSAASPSVPNSDLEKRIRSREKGTISRPCEIKTAKLTDTQAQVISPDVSCFQRQINPGSFPGINNPDSSRSPDSNHSTTSPTITTTQDERPECGTKVKKKQIKILHDCSQALAVKPGQEKAVGVIEGDKRELPNSVFTGQYSEEESTRSFQEALIQWRRESSDGKGNLGRSDALWIPMRPALVSASSTQTDLFPVREAGGQKREGADGKLRVKLEFSENTLTYMDRLLLKKHRRTPVESPPSLSFGKGSKSLPTTETDEDMDTTPTAEEEDFLQYCSSLFNVPVSQNRTRQQISTPESCLVIEVLDEISTEKTLLSIAEHSLDDDRMISKADHSTPFSTQPPRPFISSVQPKTGKKPHCPRDKNSKPDDLVTAAPSDCMASTCTAAGTSKKLAKTATSSKSISSSAMNKLKANCGSPKFSTSQTHKPFQPPDLFLTDVSILESMTSVIPQAYLSPSSSTSFPVRSTFSVSPSGSTHGVVLPKVYHSAPQQNGTEKTQSSHLFAETISSLNPYDTPRANLISPQQFQLPNSDPDCLLLDNQPRHSLSPGTVKPQPTSTALGMIMSIDNPATNNGPPYFCHTSAVKDTPVLMSLESGYHKSTPLCRGGNATDNNVDAEEDKNHSKDNGDKITGDSLYLTPPKENSYGQEVWIHGRMSKEKSGQIGNNLMIPHPEDSLRPAKKKTEDSLKTQDTEQRRETQKVMRNQTAGFGSEQFCDLEGFSPLGLDTDTGRPDSPEQTHCDGLRTCQFSVCDTDPTESGLASCTLSQASQAILEICNLDQVGCEDPDVDIDMTTRMLHSMEQELRLVPRTQCISIQALELDSGDSGSGNQDENHQFKWSGLSEEQKQEEETAERDRQSVLSLP